MSFKSSPRIGEDDAKGGVSLEGVALPQLCMNQERVRGLELKSRRRPSVGEGGGGGALNLYRWEVPS